jgi:hypothetical protein
LRKRLASFRATLKTKLPSRCIAGEPAEGLLEDVLGVLGRAEPEDEIPEQAFSMALVKLLEIEQPPLFFLLIKTPPPTRFVFFPRIHRGSPRTPFIITFY